MKTTTNLSDAAMATLTAMANGAAGGEAVSVLVRHGLVNETVEGRPYFRTNRRGEKVLVNFHVRAYAITPAGLAMVAK